MGAAFGHRWTSAYGEESRGTAGRLWAAELAGMSREQIDTGLSACRNAADPWPPSLPQFKAACLGIPPLPAVRLDGERVEPFTVLVWSFLDGYRYRAVSADQADRMLREAYDLAREHVMRGGDLPKIAAAIEQDDPKPPVELTPEERAERLAKLRAELEMGTPVAERPDPEEPKVDMVAVEAELQAHYSDRKSAAAGGA